MQTRNAFTMIEMLFVMSIILIGSVLTLPRHTIKQDTSYQDVEANITRVINQSKSTAILENRQVDITFTKYKIQNDDITYSLPSGYYFSHLVDVYFNEDGNINKANHINLHHDGKTIKLVFHLGSGDYEFQK